MLMIIMTLVYHIIQVRVFAVSIAKQLNKLHHLTFMDRVFGSSMERICFPVLEKTPSFGACPENLCFTNKTIWETHILRRSVRFPSHSLKQIALPGFHFRLQSIFGFMMAGGGNWPQLGQPKLRKAQFGPRVRPSHTGSHMRMFITKSWLYQWHKKMVKQQRPSPFPCRYPSWCISPLPANCPEKHKKHQEHRFFPSRQIAIVCPKTKLHWGIGHKKCNNKKHHKTQKDSNILGRKHQSCTTPMTGLLPCGETTWRYARFIKNHLLK